MKIICHSCSTVRTDTFKIRLHAADWPHDYKVITYTVYYDEDGRLLNSVLRNQDGTKIYDLFLLEAVQKLTENEA